MIRGCRVPCCGAIQLLASLANLARFCIWITSTGRNSEAGCSYWLTAEGPSTQNHYHSWSIDGTGEIGDIAYSVNGGQWLMSSTDSQSLGMKVGVVPEPSTFGLLAIGAIGLLGWTQRKRIAA